MPKQSNNSEGIIVFLWIVPIVLAIAIYWPVLCWLVQKWIHNPMYSHGFLIPPLSLWLVWRARPTFGEPGERSVRWGIFLLVVALAVQAVSAAVDVKTAGAYSLILLILAAIYFLFGRKATRATLFPVGFLFFMVPLHDAVTDPISLRLKLLVARLAVWLLDTSQILVVVREGVMIHMPSGSLEVADPCSGIRSLIALSALGALIGYLHEGKLWERLAIVLAVAPIAIVANLTRVIMLCLVTEQWGADAVESQPVHIATGIIVYVVALGCLVSFGRLLHRDRRRPEPG